MDTVIHIDLKSRRDMLCFAALLLFLPSAQAAEQEIYVTTGPDGVEILSNLPRGPLAPVSLSAQPALARLQGTEDLSPPEFDSVNTERESGKGFMFDD
jgi:hypothetical protein